MEFQNAVQSFCKKIIGDVLSKNKGLKNNRAFKKAVKNAGLSKEVE